MKVAISRTITMAVPIENEQDPEILRTYALDLRNQVLELSRELARIKGEEESCKQLALSQQLQDQLSRLQKKYFGSGTEQLPGTAARVDRPNGHPKESLKLHGEYVQDGKEAVTAGIKPSGPVTFTYKMSERELAAENLLRNIAGGAAAWAEVSGLYQEAREITVFGKSSILPVWTGFTGA